MSAALEPLAVTIKQACVMLNVRRNTLYRLRRAKRLTDHVVGDRGVRLLVEELKKLVEKE
jgi:excisionase family DNA binding protein